MITKERLEELIEQGVTIYTLERKEIILDDDMFVTDDRLCKYDWSILLENLFETKEEAKWQLEFGNIQRTETLSLPSWEEFNNEDKLITFTTYPYNYHLLKYSKNICVRSFYGAGGMDLFLEPLTKENYLKACEICRKLWLGEEV